MKSIARYAYFIPLMSLSYALQTLDLTPEINYYKLSFALILMLVAYHLYYRFSKKLFKKSFLAKFTEEEALISEYHSRVLAMTTCSLITLTAIIYYVPAVVSNFFEPVNLFNMKLQYFDKFVLFLLFGYLVHDLFWCMTHNWHDVLNYIHHGVSIWFCITMLIVNNTAFEAAIGLTLAESSNVFLHLRWFVKFFKGRSSLLCDVLFAFAFFLTRIVGGGWITYWLIKVDGPLPVRFMCYTLDILNLGFFWQIVNMMLRQMRRMKEEKIEQQAHAKGIVLVQEHVKSN